MLLIICPVFIGSFYYKQARPEKKAKERKQRRSGRNRVVVKIMKKFYVIFNIFQVLFLFSAAESQSGCTTLCENSYPPHTTYDKVAKKFIIKYVFDFCFHTFNI